MKSGELKLGKMVGLSDGLPPNRYEMKLYEYSSMKSGALERDGWEDGMSLDDNDLDWCLITSSIKTSDTILPDSKGW